MKSKIGMFFAGAYVLLVVVIIADIMISPPDAMSGLALMTLAMPWSFILFEAVHDIAPPIQIVGIALYAICVFLNAAILYFFGLLVSCLFSVLGKWIDRQNESASKTTQD